MSPNQVFQFFRQDRFLVVSGVPPGSLFEVILGPKSGSWEPESRKMEVRKALEKRPEKHVKKVTRVHAGPRNEPPCGSIKEPAECRPADQQTTPGT